MTPEEAKNKMDEMVFSIHNLHLSGEFEIAIYVPKDIADLAKHYYEDKIPFGRSGPFAAGEVFYYHGIKCFAG